MADYGTMSDADLLALVQPKPTASDYSKMSDADLLKMVQPHPSITDAVTDIPAEIGRTAGANWETIKKGLTPSERPGIMDTGKALLAIPGLAASPITGTLRSLIGHPMAQAEHAIGTVINPEVAAKDDPQKMYEQAAGDVETALSAARPVGGSPRAFTPPTRPPVAPSVPELKSAARAAYNHPEVAAVEIRPQAVAGLSAQIEQDLAQQGFRPRAGQGASTFQEVRDLTPGAGVQSVRVADIDSARKSLGLLAKEVDAVGQPTAEAAAASRAIDHINDFLPSLTQPDLVAGNAARASSILDQARSDWGAAKRAEKIDLQLTRADRQAAKSGSGSNIENSMRQKIATLLDNPKRTVGFSDAEKAAMESIVRGTATRNTLRKVGKLGVDGGLSLLLHAGSVVPTGGANIPVAIGGTIARKIGERLTARSGRQLSEMVRSRSALSQGNQGMRAVQNVLSPRAPARASIPYSSIISALLSQQGQRRAMP